MTGVPVPCLRSDLVKAVLAGKDNFDEEEARSKPKRQPMTIKHLKLLKLTLLLDKSRSPMHKKLIFAVAVIAFNACLRVGELLSKQARSIDPLNCLLRRDIWLAKERVGGKVCEYLNVRLKSDKSSRAATRNVVIETFANNTEFCPVQAFKDYIKCTGKGRLDSAAFRSPEGWAYRHQRFNEDLKSLLEPYLHYSGISGHSFRIGFASLLAQAGN